MAGGEVALQALARQRGAGHRVAEDHARDRDEVLRLPPGVRADDHADHVGERRGGRDGERRRGNPEDPGDRLCQTRHGRVGGDGRHHDQDQQHPVPLGGREHGGQDEADEVELDQRAQGADGEVALEPQPLAGRDHDEDTDQEQRETQLPEREIDDADAARHG